MSGPDVIRIRVYRDDFERFAKHIDASGDCWEWTGTRTSTGYGQAASGRKGRHVYAHRAVWEALVGPIAGGLQIDHLCRNRRCVNPDHLEPVTPRENTRRGFATAKRLNRTACLHGHEYTPENTRIEQRGEVVFRRCKTCMRAYYQRSARYARRHPQAVA